MTEKDSMVLYGSMYRQYKQLRRRGRNEEALEYINAIMEYGFEGIEPDEDSDVWLFGFDANKIAIDNATARYAKAIENGSHGGRATIELDEEEVMQKKAELKTWGAVAKFFGVDEKTLRKRRTEWENGKMGKTQIREFPEIREKREKQNPEFREFSGKWENGKNLNDTVNVPENVTEKEVYSRIYSDGFLPE